MSRKSIALAATVLMVSVLTGCAKTGDKVSTEGTDKKTETTTSEKKTGEPVVSTTPTPGSGQLPSQIKVNIDELPNDMAIVTVGNKTIKVGDYRRMMKLQSTQMQASIGQNPMVRQQLLNEAKKRGVSLTSDEQTKLISTAKEQSTKESKDKDFAAFLKEKKITEQQYDKEVSDVGLVYKMSNVILQEGLLPELVNRELLSTAAAQAGLEKQALDRYSKVKNSKEMAQLSKATDMPSDVLKNEIVKAELAKMQIEQIAKGIKVTEKEVQTAYDANKKNLKHNERIRLSSILVAAPEVDQGPIQSVRSQVLKANPKLEGKDLDATVAQVLTQQQQKALVILGRARGGEDFAKLSNENTDDLQSKIKKSGGDLGWQEKQQLIPQFAEAVWGMKAGEVLPKLVKTGLGYQIIKVTGREKAAPYALKDVKPILEAKVRQDKLQMALNKWIMDKKQAIKVEFAPDFLAMANGKKPATH